MSAKSPAFIVNASSRTLEGPQGEETLARLGGLCPVPLLGVFRDGDPAKAARKALEAGADTVITLGGDGTAQAAAQAIYDGGAQARLVALPMGTANILPRRLYGTRSVEAILEGLAELEPATLPGGRLGGEVFLVAAAAGFPTTFAQAREAVRAKDLPRRLQTVLNRSRAGLTELFAPRIRFTADGAEHETLSRASGLMVWVEAEADRFDFAAVNVHTLGDLAGAAIGALNEDLRTDDRLLVRKARSVTLRARRAIPCMLDGEPRDAGRDVTFTFEEALIPALRAPQD